MSLKFITELLFLVEKNQPYYVQVGIVSAARSLTCRDDLDSKWRLLLAENELARVSLLC